jgi:TPR repeat protein
VFDGLIKISMFLLLSVASSDVRSGETSNPVFTHSAILMILSEALEAYDGGDFDTARDNWTRAAHAGNSDAMTALANLYLQGEGIAMDRTQALMWYRRAAAVGDEIAQLNLGELMAKGQVIRRDNVGAYFWLSLAGRAGNSWAANEATRVGRRLSVDQRLQTERRVTIWKPETR